MEYESSSVNDLHCAVSLVCYFTTQFIECDAYVAGSLELSCLSWVMFGV